MELTYRITERKNNRGMQTFDPEYFEGGASEINDDTYWRTCYTGTVFNTLESAQKWVDADRLEKDNFKEEIIHHYEV
jgi:hypothetical protein